MSIPPRELAVAMGALAFMAGIGCAYGSTGAYDSGPPLRAPNCAEIVPGLAFECDICVEGTLSHDPPADCRAFYACACDKADAAEILACSSRMGPSCEAYFSQIRSMAKEFCAGHNPTYCTGSSLILSDGGLGSR
jgi:hypothetical protein